MPQRNNLGNYSPENLESKSELSIYKGELTQNGLLENVQSIKKAFPNLPIDFYDKFIDRIKSNGFGDDRLTDAVNHVIDNCMYPTPTIAQFIGFDKTVKVYNYAELVNDRTGLNWDEIKLVKLIGRKHKVWINENDIDKVKHLIESE